MREPKRFRMKQNLGISVLLLPVLVVADDRMSDVLHVHANLVGPARLQSEFQVGVFRKTLENPEVRDCILSPLHNRHQFSVLEASSNWGFNPSEIVFNNPVDNGVVFPRDPVFREISAQRPVREIVLAGDEESRSALVQPVDDSRPRHAPDAGKIHAMVQERVHERPVGVPRGRVDDESRGLVDDDQVGILVINVQGDVLRNDFTRNEFRYLYFHKIPPFHDVARFHDFAVYEDASRFDQGLNLRPRHFLELVGEVFVQADAFFRLDFETQFHLLPVSPNRMSRQRKMTPMVRHMSAKLKLGKEIKSKVTKSRT